MGDANPSENNIKQSTVLLQEDIEAKQLAELELADKLIKLEDELNASRTPTETAIAQNFDKQVANSEVIAKINSINTPKSKTTKKDMVRDIGELEKILKVEPAVDCKIMTRDECAKYLAKLIDMASVQISTGVDLTPSVEPVDVIPKPGPDKNKSADEPIQSTVVKDLKNEIKQNQTSILRTGVSPQDLQNSEALFRLNMMFLYVAETLGEPILQEQYNTSLNGATRQLKEDFAPSDSSLRSIYLRIYLEHKPTISQYLSPLSELAVYNLSLVGAVAAKNAQNGIKKN